MALCLRGPGIEPRRGGNQIDGHEGVYFLLETLTGATRRGVRCRRLPHLQIQHSFFPSPKSSRTDYKNLRVQVLPLRVQYTLGQPEKKGLV